MANETLRPYLWMLLGSLAFSCMGMLAHHVGKNNIDRQIVAVFRSVIPLVLVGAWGLAAGVKFAFLRPPVLWMRSIAGSISLVGTFYALTRLPISDVFTVTNMFPVWVAMLSWPLLGEFPGPKVWLSVACGAAGVVLIQRPHIMDGNFAILVALSVSLCTALAMIGLHRLQGLDTRAVVVHFSAVSLLFALGALWIFPRELEWHQLQSWEMLDLAGVGLCATLGQVCLTKAFTLGDPAKISVVGLTQIVFSLILDVLVLGHSLEPLKLAGIPLVIAPTAWLLLRHHHPVKSEGFSDEPIETTPNIAE
jgi:drug/metabolite transporter (DMT)-like permease